MSTLWLVLHALSCSCCLVLGSGGFSHGSFLSPILLFVPYQSFFGKGLFWDIKLFVVIFIIMTVYLFLCLCFMFKVAFVPFYKNFSIKITCRVVKSKKFWRMRWTGRGEGRKVVFPRIAAYWSTRPTHSHGQ